MSERTPAPGNSGDEPNREPGALDDEREAALMREVLRTAPLFLGFTVAQMGYGGLSNRASSGLRATREFEGARRKNRLTKIPDWLSPRVWRAVVYELLRRAFGQRVARSVADAYKAVTPRR